VNGNGRIDDGSEMLGDGWRLANGARVTYSLEPLIAIQGFPSGTTSSISAPGIAFISKEDAVFARLRLWTDANHNGRAEPTELVSLADAGVRSISLAFLASRRPTADAQHNTTLTLGTVTFERPQTFLHKATELLGLSSSAPRLYERQMALITLAH
jgi:hypothetical protein